MQRVIKNFSNDLAKDVRKSRFRNSIISIVLLGSAARGEWIRGESDVDFIVVSRDKKDKKPVTAFMSKVLKKLDKRYRLRLEETCTDMKKHDNEILKAIFKMESSVFFGVPFHVISYDEYDFMKNKIRDPKIWLLATFLGSMNSFLPNIRETGKTIYGRDLLKEIKTKISFSDKIKICMQQSGLLLTAMLLLPFNAKLALKASLYQEEFDLLLLHKHLKGYNKIKPDTAEAAHFILSSMKFVLINGMRA